MAPQTSFQPSFTTNAAVPTTTQSPGMPYKSAATEAPFSRPPQNFSNTNFEFPGSELTVSDQELTALLSQKDATSLAEDLLKHFGSDSADLDEPGKLKLF